MSSTRASVKPFFAKTMTPAARTPPWVNRVASEDAVVLMPPSSSPRGLRAIGTIHDVYPASHAAKEPSPAPPGHHAAGRLPLRGRALPRLGGGARSEGRAPL